MGDRRPEEGYVNTSGPEYIKWFGHMEEMDLPEGYKGRREDLSRDGLNSLELENNYRSLYITKLIG